MDVKSGVNKQCVDLKNTVVWVGQRPNRLTSHIPELVTNDSIKVLYFTNQQLDCQIRNNCLKERMNNAEKCTSNIAY